MLVVEDADPSTWTLRFKHGRITILLYIEPLTPFATLKSDLLDTLRERYPLGLPAPSNGSGTVPEIQPHTQIPDSIEDIALGVPVDECDAGKGWQELVLMNGGTGIRDSPKSLGLKDRGMVAFRFKKGDEMEGAGESLFEVTLPTYEETYGEGAEIDEASR
ncbi:MAG: hypothetical protein M1818_003611 [Claussenomyces sp. TS43310]|nr:MAG: hypothetical protein M1818_003611 [Claussenomyces sp. TS43310]